MYGILFSVSESNNTYMANEVNSLELSNIVMFTTSGQSILTVDSVEDFNEDVLESGVYILKGMKAEIPVTYRVLKK